MEDPLEDLQKKNQGTVQGSVRIPRSDKNLRDLFKDLSFGGSACRTEAKKTIPLTDPKKIGSCEACAL